VRKAAQLVLIAVLLTGLPLAGVALTGRPIARYLEFPPVTQYVPHAPFSWPVFFGLAAVILAAAAPAVARLATVRAPDERLAAGQPFPFWGWGGVVLIAVGWVLAWTRFPWFADLQPYTFTPLWLGYIVVINALTVRQTGSSLLTRRPGYLLSLFPLSAAFWWFFEYLNRFVQNWHYHGIREFSAAEYAFHATVSFSTVLPAVMGTIDWLSSFSTMTKGFQNLPSLGIRHPKSVGILGVMLGGAGLVGIGVWPDYLFPMVWMAPLMLITAIQALDGQRTIFSDVRHGDWRRVGIPALAALVCGFFWELWNVNSQAHWEYTIPFVHRYMLFEMPLLGYAGYLPFGLECAVVAGLIANGSVRDPASQPLEAVGQV
jgi:hypothetical protein